MAELKRFFTKYIRDAVKSQYKKKGYCEICGTVEDLEFHHFSSLSILVNNWQKKNKIIIETAEEAFLHRDKFIEEHLKEIYDDTATLCKSHHKKLHVIYGKSPALATSAKQARWVQKQKDKHELV